MPHSKVVSAARPVNLCDQPLVTENAINLLRSSDYTPQFEVQAKSLERALAKCGDKTPAGIVRNAKAIHKSKGLDEALSFLEIQMIRNPRESSLVEAYKDLVGPSILALPADNPKKSEWLDRLIQVYEKRANQAGSPELARQEITPLLDWINKNALTPIHQDLFLNRSDRLNQKYPPFSAI